MNRRILVEDSLTNVKDVLLGQGYEVGKLSTEKNNLEGYDAIVVSGQDKNFMGITNTVTKSPVIDARNKSAEDILNQINQLQGKLK
ncbi:MAG: YkuS family protein [Firmicutes bacterium]|nr:YkuS family protein [Bacillota bacterium]